MKAYHPATLLNFYGGVIESVSRAWLKFGVRAEQRIQLTSARSHRASQCLQSNLRHPHPGDQLHRVPEFPLRG